MKRIAHMHNTGLLLVATSALVFSSAGIFTNAADTDAWGVIFWRGLAAAAFALAYLLLSGRLRSQIHAFDRRAALVTLVMAAGTAAFIPAFKLSSVADVAMIYAAAPLVAAALAWIFVAEVPTGKVMLASVAALAGVAIILNDSIGAGRLPGNFLALFMTLMMAGAMVIYRKWPHIPVALPAALSSLILLPPAAMFGSPMSAPRHELPILIAFGLVFTVASITLLEGARRLPSADAALVSSLETPLAPLLAYLILSEIPSADMVLGGCIIFTAVLWSQRSTTASQPLESATGPQSTERKRSHPDEHCQRL